MKIYLIKIAMHGVSPMVWRRLKIPGNTSIAQLHEAIQIAFGWDDEYLNQFHIYGKDYGVYHDGGLNFSDDPEQVYLDDFEFDPLDKFTYEYNFFDHWLVDVRIEAIEESAEIEAPINCVKGNGILGVSKYDVMEAKCNLIKGVAEALIKTDKTTLIEDIRPLFEALNAVKFNRRRINQHLQTGLMDL